MNQSDYQSVASAIIGGVFLISACIMFATADAVTRSSETNTSVGSPGMGLLSWSSSYSQRW